MWQSEIIPMETLFMKAAASNRSLYLCIFLKSAINIPGRFNIYKRNTQILGPRYTTLSYVK